MIKSELRKIYLAQRKSLSPFEHQEKSRQISDLFFRSFDLGKIQFLHCYLPIEKFNEIDTRFIFERIWREFPKIKTLVPKINYQTNQLAGLKYSSETELRPNNWQINEPLHDEIIENENIDAVLVPLLCFDERGFRVGYGKGFYDRFLAECRTDCLKIGLSFFAPIREISDINEFDVKLDFCVLPNKIFTVKQ